VAGAVLGAMPGAAATTTGATLAAGSGVAGRIRNRGNETGLYEPLDPNRDFVPPAAGYHPPSRLKSDDAAAESRPRGRGRGRKKSRVKSASRVTADLDRHATNQPWERPTSCTFADGVGVLETMGPSGTELVVEIEPGDTSLLGRVTDDLDAVRDGRDSSNVIDGSNYAGPPFSEGIYYTYVIDDNRRLHYAKMTGYPEVTVCSKEYRERVADGNPPFREGDGSERSQVSAECYSRIPGSSICHACLVNWDNENTRDTGYIAGAIGVIAERQTDGEITQLSVVADHRSGHFSEDGEPVAGSDPGNAGTSSQARVAANVFGRYLMDADPAANIRVASVEGFSGVMGILNGIRGTRQNWETMLRLV